MKAPKLSICIPTYNREKYLTALLDSILIAAPDDGSLQICISDNASSDETQPLIASYKERYPYITYFRWNENKGADHNFLKVVEIASGEYCWLLGSDDMIVENAIEIVLGLLKHDLDILLLKNIGCDYNMVPQHKVENFSFTGSGVFELSKENEFIKFCQSAKGLASIFSYLSILVFKRLRWASQDNIPTFLIGTLYSHVYMLMNFFSDNKPTKIGCFNKYLIYSRSNPVNVAESSDMSSRILIDFGYLSIINNIFSNDIVKRDGLMLILKKELDRRYFRSYRPLWIKLNSGVDTWTFAMTMYQFHYGFKLSIKIAKIIPGAIDKFALGFFRLMKKTKNKFGL